MPSPRPRPRLATVLAATSLVVAAGTAFIGYLHTPSGRPLLRALVGDRCPAAFASASTAEHARRLSVARSRGGTPAPARPALGFTLEATTTDDVLAWAQRSLVRCDREVPWLIRCRDVPSELLGGSSGTGTVEELTLGFREDGRLVNVATLRRGLTPVEGRRVRDALAGALARVLGAPPTRTPGDVGASRLSSSRSRVRYADYLANITVVNLPTTGVAVREQYLSARD